MSIFDGVEGLSDEQKAKLEGNLKAVQDDIESLKDQNQKILAKNQELLDETKAAKEQKRKEAEEAEAARLKAAEKDGDLKSLKESYEKIIAEKDNQLASFVQKEKTFKIEEIVSPFIKDNVVSDPFSQRAMKDEIMKRLDVREGELVVLDPAGNLTGLSVDDLKKEILSTSDYKGHLIGSKANGGGANGSKDNSGGGAVKKFEDYKSGELVQLRRENPAEYDRLVAEKNA